MSSLLYLFQMDTQPPQQPEGDAAPTGGANEKPDAPAEAAPEKPADPPKQLQKKIRKVVHELPIVKLAGRNVNLGPLIEFEREMQQTDLNEKLKADAKNAVEEYVYSMREKLCEQLAEFVTEQVSREEMFDRSWQESEQFRSLLTATEDWLYDEGEDVAREVYEKKLAEIREVIEPPINRRQREKKDQEEVERNLKEAECEFQAEKAAQQPTVEEPME